MTERAVTVSDAQQEQVLRELSGNPVKLASIVRSAQKRNYREPLLKYFPEPWVDDTEFVELKVLLLSVAPVLYLWYLYSMDYQMLVDNYGHNQPYWRKVISRARTRVQNILNGD